MDAIKTRAEKAIHEKVFPGCVIGLLAKGKTHMAAFGREKYHSDSPKVTVDTLYDVASITKSVPTATLALQLIDAGEIALDDKLIKYIPEYRTKYRDEVLIQHLLTYTLGNTAPLSSLALTTPDEIFEVVCTEEGNPPGTVFSYSNTPALLLGMVIERVLTTPLDRAAEERIFRPLRMTSSTYTPHGAAPTEVGIQDIVHDESARVFSRAGRAVGHAGLFSTTPDLLNFCETLLKNDEIVLSKEMIDQMTSNQIPNLDEQTGLGWELNQPWMGNRRSERTFGKTGFTGTSIVCEAERQIAIVILSNRTYPNRPADNSAINKFRSDVCDIVFQL